MIKEFNPFFLKKILFRLKKILNTKVSSNIIWLIFDKIFRISLSFFVGIFVARYLGPENFGILNYAIALVGVFGSFATGGLTDVSIKEILKGGNKNIILGSIFWLQIILSTLVILPITTMAFISSNDNAQEPLIILFIALSLLFQSNLNVKIWFESQLQSKYIVLTENFIAILISIIKILLVYFKASLIEFALIILIESIFSYFLLLFIFNHKVDSPFNWSVNFAMCKLLLKKSFPIILSGTAIILYMRIDIIILAYLTNYTSVGEYSAALRLSEVWYIAPLVFANSLFPNLIKLHQKNNFRYVKYLQKIFIITVNIAIIVAIIISITSKDIIYLIYGDQYKNASNILTIHIWTCVFVFLGIFCSKHYIIENLQHLSAYRTIFGLIANTILNFIFIPFFGTIGAASSTLISFFLVDYLFDYFNLKTRNIFFMKTKAIFWLPILLYKTIIR